MIDSYGAHSNKHAWLGIDPGLTTGWAILEDRSGDVIGSGNLEPEQVEKMLDTLVRAMHGEGYALHVVVEEMPRAGGMSRLSGRLEEVRKAVYTVVQDVYDLAVTRITPGEWKPSRVAKTTKVKRGLTPHQRDAIRMTAYAIDKERRRAK